MSTTAGGVALVLTNLALLPALWYAVRANLFVEFGLLSAVFMASTAFHICQASFFCFGVSLFALQVTDHLLVFLAIVHFSLYVVNASLVARTAITFVATPIILPVVVTFLHDFVSGAIAITVAVVAAAIMFVIIITINGRIYLDWKSVVIVVILMAGGIALHLVGGDFSADNNLYPALHSAWHVAAMVALLFVLDIPFGRTSVLKLWYHFLRGQNKPRTKRKAASAPRRPLFGGGADTVAIDVSPSRRHDKRQKSTKNKGGGRRKEEKRRQRRERDDALDRQDVGSGVYSLYGEVAHT